MRSVIHWLVVAIMAYAAYAGLLFAMQRSIMFPASGADMPAPPSSARGALALATSFGPLHAVHLQPAGSGPAPALLYFHGNYEFVADNVGLLKPLAARGLHVLLVEYPGYAGSAGAPSYDTLVEGAIAGYDWLAARADVDRTRIVAFGRSIGSGPACELAGHRDLRALVLLSPFTSVAAFARSRGLPAFLVRDPFDNLARVRAWRGPLLVMHGRYDEVIPYAHGRELAAAGSNAELATLDCGHNDCPFLEQPMLDALDAFFARVGVTPDRTPRHL